MSKEGRAVVVAVTKVDKLQGPDEVAEACRKIETQLAEHGIMAESLGGDVQVVPVSAVTGEGLEDLIERLALQAEMMELRAEVEGAGEGLVLDSGVDKGLGIVASVLVRWGQVRPGQLVVVGTQVGRVRKILDGSGQALESATPSLPVRVLGLKEMPSPGDDVLVLEDEDRAERIVEARKARRAEEEMKTTEMWSGDEEWEAERQEIMATQMQAHHVAKKTKAHLLLQMAGRHREEGQRQIVVPFLVKADGKGLLEALTASLAAYESEVIKAQVIHAGCGAITLGDLEMAKAAGAGDAAKGEASLPAVVLGFGVGYSNSEAREVARRDKLSVHTQGVIYTLLDDAKAALQKLVPMERKEELQGRLEVQQVGTLYKRGRLSAAALIRSTYPPFLRHELPFSLVNGRRRHLTSCC